MLKKILVGIVLLVAVFIVIMMMQPSNYHVERTARINAPAEIVWTQISDFEHWKAWNPWQKLDPEQRITISGDAGTVGHSSHWAGENTGKGTMTISEATEPSRLVINLDFDEPMESQAQTTLDVDPQGDAVDVTWSIDGANDFMGKFFGLVMGMEDMIGSAYESGLADLKLIAEENAEKLAEAQTPDAADTGAASVGETAPAAQ